MSHGSPTVDPRLVHAVELFNSREYFACHDVLEEIWSETLAEDRGFYQGLIHAAVALFHFTEGNLGGARKMSFSAQRYLSPYQPQHAELQVKRFLEDFAICCRELQSATEVSLPSVQVDAGRLPRLDWRAARGDSTPTNANG